MTDDELMTGVLSHVPDMRVFLVVRGASPPICGGLGQTEGDPQPARQVYGLVSAIAAGLRLPPIKTGWIPNGHTVVPYGLLGRVDIVLTNAAPHRSLLADAPAYEEWLDGVTAAFRDLVRELPVPTLPVPTPKALDGIPAGTVCEPRDGPAHTENCPAANGPSGQDCKCRGGRYVWGRRGSRQLGEYDG